MSDDVECARFASFRDVCAVQNHARDVEKAAKEQLVVIDRHDFFWVWIVLQVDDWNRLNYPRKEKRQPTQGVVFSFVKRVSQGENEN